MAENILRVRIEAAGGSEAAGDVQNFNRELTNTGTAAERGKEGLGHFSESAEQLRGIAERLRGTLESLGIAFGLREILERATQIKVLASELGVTTDRMQELAYVATTAGQNMDMFTMALRKQATLVEAGAEGQKKAAETLNALGLSAKALLAIPLDQQYQIIAKSLLGVENATKQTALAQELWGRQGMVTLGVLREHKGELDAVAEEAHKYGQILSADAIDKLHGLEVGLKTAGIAWLNWASESGSAVDIVIDWLKELATWPPKIQKMWEGMWTAIETDRAQGYADKLKAINDQVIDQLLVKQTYYRDQVTKIISGASELTGNAAQAEIMADNARIASIGNLIAARQKDTQAAYASVGAVKASADAHSQEADIEGKLDAQLRQAALKKINYAKGHTDVAEATKKASEAGENWLAQLQAEVELLKANYDQAFRLQAIRHKVPEDQIAAAVSLEKYIEDLKLEKKADEELEKAHMADAAALAKLDETIAQEYQDLYLTNEQRAIENQLRQAGLLAGTADYAQRKQELAALQQTKDQLNLLKDMAGGIKEGFETAFEDIFSKGKSGFKDLVDSIEKWFLKLLADLALMAAANPIRMVLTTAAGALGMSNPEGAAGSIMGQMMPYGNLTQATGINPYQYVSSLFGGGAGTAGVSGFGAYAPAQGLEGFSGGFEPAAAAGGGWGGTIGMAAGAIGGGLAGYGIGGMAAGWYGGNSTGGSIGGAIGGAAGAIAAPAIASAAGIAVGAAWGSVVPIVGTIIGAVLGGLLGGLFGGGQPDPYHLSLATGKQFPVSGRSTIKGYEDNVSQAGPFGQVGFILRGTNDLFDANKQKDFLNAIVQIDQAFAQFLNPTETAAVKDRLANMNEAEFTNSFNAVTALKQRFEEMLGAVDPALKKVYDSLNITADNAGQFAVSLLGIRKEITDLNAAIQGTGTDPVQQFTSNIQALDQQLQAAAEAGRQALASGDPTQVMQAEQTLRQAVAARYQYEMQVATQLQQVIEGLKATITQLAQQMYQLRVSEYKDWLDINQRIQQTGGGGVTQLSIYRQAGAELLGAYQGETDPARRLELLKQGMELVDQGLAARMAEIDEWVQAQQQAAQQRIDALNQEKAQIQAAAQARIEALNAELQATQQWAQLLPSIQQQLDSMRYGGTNPLSSFARLQTAETDLAGVTDPNRRLQLLQQIMQLGGEAYQRPSPEYQQIYNQVVSELSAMQTQAQAAADHARELQEQIAAANTEMQQSLASIDAQIAQLSDMTEIQRQAAEMQRQARTEANTYYQWIRDQGAQQYDLLQQQLAGQISVAQQQLDTAQQQMDLLTQGAGYVQFMADHQARMTDLLTQILDALVQYLTPGAEASNNASGQAAPAANQSEQGNVNLTINVDGRQITKEDIDYWGPYIKRILKTA